MRASPNVFARSRVSVLGVWRLRRRRPSARARLPLRPGPALPALRSSFSLPASLFSPLPLLSFFPFLVRRPPLTLSPLAPARPRPPRPCSARACVVAPPALVAMASTAGQPQFRYTQPPSKVLHVRNLPWECSEEELIELCKPFGKVVNTKVNVGANHNQAFVEFVSLPLPPPSLCAFSVVSLFPSDPLGFR